VGNTENALPIGDVEQEKVESPSTSLASLIIVTLMSWSKNSLPKSFALQTVKKKLAQ
jgi:hypothetical protein